MVGHYGELRWLFWFASVILLLLATLGMAAVIPGIPAWLFPAGVLAFVLASGGAWVVP